MVEATLEDKLHLISKFIVNGKNDESSHAEAFNKYRAYFDNTVMPFRIHGAVMVGNLSTEQSELANKNQTLVNVQREQLNVIDRVVTDFYNKGFSSFRSFQRKDFKINHREFQIRHLTYSFMIFAISMILLGLSLMGKMNMAVSSSIIAMLVISYSIFFYLKVQQNRMRRKYEWDKMYYKGPKTKDQCSNSDEYSI
jgi:type IV secretory pathway VirB3-like protein